MCETIEHAIGYGASHIRLQRFTPSEDWYVAHKDSTSPRYRLPAEEEREELRHEAADLLEQEGFHEYYPGYFAPEGHESRIALLRAQGFDEIGFGAGAESAMDGVGSRTIRNIRDYCRYSPDPEKLTSKVWMMEAT